MLETWFSRTDVHPDRHRRTVGAPEVSAARSDDAPASRSGGKGGERQAAARRRQRKLAAQARGDARAAKLFAGLDALEASLCPEATPSKDESALKAAMLQKSATMLFEKLSTQEKSLLGALGVIEERVQSSSASQAALAETCHRLDAQTRLHLQQLLGVTTPRYAHVRASSKWQRTWQSRQHKKRPARSPQSA